MSYTKFFKLFSVLTCLTLAACGGGGSSSSDNSDPLKPSATATPNPSGTGSSFQVLWGDSEAIQYRVIYSREGERESPRFSAISPDTEFTSPEVEPGTYEVIVEGYDALGNSAFSDPETVTVGVP